MKYFEVNFRIDTPSDNLRDDVADVVAALAGEAGFETFEHTARGLTGYVQQTAFDEDTLKTMLQQLPFEHTSVTYTVSEADDRDWNAAWEEQGFEPISVGHDDIIVHDGRHLPCPTPQALMIEINARMAFGTGNHQTTRLMLQALTALPLQGTTVIDCGTGTGILAIAALLLGAGQAVGYDIDEWSVDNARHNAAINGVSDRFTALLGDAGVLITISTPADVIVANINRNILTADMPRMRQVLKPGGWLLLSGFYTADAPLLQQQARELGLHLHHEHHEDDWCCLVFSLDGAEQPLS